MLVGVVGRHLFRRVETIRRRLQPQAKSHHRQNYGETRAHPNPYGIRRPPELSALRHPSTAVSVVNLHT
jgi:hypothetical protein